jgi:peptidoglycan hydrolase-like protein with peptidoglycan-binding domain
MEAAMAEPILQKGSTDPAVRDLQEALKTLGFNPGPIDGQFGTVTEAAVKAFQQQRGIPVDGVVGKVTWINIDEADQSEPVLDIGSTGLPVRRAQKRMSLVGFDVGGVDGQYVRRTVARLRPAQFANRAKNGHLLPFSVWTRSHPFTIIRRIGMGQRMGRRGPSVREAKCR